MSRTLLVPGAIIAVLVCGIWVHATHAPASRSKTASVHTTPADRVASAIKEELVQPAPSERVTPAPVPARTHARRPARIATPTRVVAPQVGEAQVAEAQPAESRLSASMKIPADGAGQPSGPALTIEEMQALARQETQGLVTIRNADGSETLNHEDRFRDYTVLKVGPDGQPVFVCVQGKAALKQTLRPAAPATKPTEPPATPKGDR